jgi:four helix bundle protein
MAIAFAQKVCQEVVPVLPSEEKWVMATQLRRAAQSIPSNIAEGYGRYYYQDNVRFCYIARGSLEETFSYLTLANRLEYLPADLFSYLIADVNRLRRLINGYVAYLKASKRGATEPGAGLSIREGSDNYQFNQPSETDTE